MDIKSLSALKLQKAIDAQYEIGKALCDEMIAAGRGYENHREIAAKTDELSLRYLAACALEFDLVSEKQERLKYHGSMKPIKRQA